MTKLTTPTGGRYNDVGPINPGKKHVVQVQPRVFAPVVFDKPEDAPIKNTSTTTLYDGAELRAFDKRVGAMDFQKHPSLISGVRVPCKGGM